MGGGSPYNGLYRVAPPKRSTFFRMEVHKRVGISLVKCRKQQENLSKYLETDPMKKYSVATVGIEGGTISYARYMKGLCFLSLKRKLEKAKDCLFNPFLVPISRYIFSLLFLYIYITSWENLFLSLGIFSLDLVRRN